MCIAGKADDDDMGRIDTAIECQKVPVVYHWIQPSRYVYDYSVFDVPYSYSSLDVQKLLRTRARRTTTPSRRG